MLWLQSTKKVFFEKTDTEEICHFFDVSKSKEVLIVNAVSFLFPFTIQFLKISIQHQLQKNEPKSDDRLSKFDWHDLPPFSLTIMLLH